MARTSYWPVRPPPRRPFVFCGAGLGDVARRFYMTNTYTALEEARSTLTIVCFSHNPAATQFFRFHPNHRHLVIADMGHVYLALLQDPKVPRPAINQTIFAMCGLRDAEQITVRREPAPLKRFHAPDHPETGEGYFVLHPFGRGWGDWPPETIAAVVRGLGEVLGQRPVYVVAADHVANDGRRKFEEFPVVPGVTVLRNLSAPAAFTLVAGAAGFIGSMSALAQVASFEDVPCLVLHPARCRDFGEVLSDYGRTIWERNGASLAFDSCSSDELAGVVARFVAAVGAGAPAASALADLPAMPVTS